MDELRKFGIQARLHPARLGRGGNGVDLRGSVRRRECGRSYPKTIASICRRIEGASPSVYRRYAWRLTLICASAASLVDPEQDQPGSWGEVIRQPPGTFA